MQYAIEQFCNNYPVDKKIMSNYRFVAADLEDVLVKNGDAYKGMSAVAWIAIVDPSKILKDKKYS